MAGKSLFGVTVVSAQKVRFLDLSQRQLVAHCRPRSDCLHCGKAARTEAVGTGVGISLENSLVLLGSSSPAGTICFAILCDERESLQRVRVLLLPPRQGPLLTEAV